MYFKLKWWQLLLYEIAIISIGIFIGTKWHQFFSGYIYSLLFVFFVCGAIVLYFIFNQIKEDVDNK